MNTRGGSGPDPAHNQDSTVGASIKVKSKWFLDEVPTKSSVPKLRFSVGRMRLKATKFNNILSLVYSNKSIKMYK